MLTITRRHALQIRSVLRRAFGHFRGPGPAIGFIADKEGLTVKAMSADAAVEFRMPLAEEATPLWRVVSHLPHHHKRERRALACP